MKCESNHSKGEKELMVWNWFRTEQFKEKLLR